MKKIPRPLNKKELAQLREMSMERHGLGMYQYNFEGIITYIDEITMGFFDLFHLYSDPSEVIGKKLDELITYTGTKGSLRNQLKEKGHFYGSSYHYKTLKGDDRWCIHDAYRVKHPETGEPLIHVVIRDISDRIKAEKAEKELQNQLYLSQKREAIGLLAGGISHDFNNILQIIMGYADLIESGMCMECKQRDSLKQISLGGLKASNLISQLMSYSRQQTLKMEEVDINSLLDETLKMLNPILGDNIEINLIKTPDLPNTWGDRGQLSQIITNLCINARDALNSGGQITIKTILETLDLEFCKSHSWASPGSYLCIRVQDNGIGMDEETLSQIFDPFFSTKDRDKGTGLGLSTVYGLVEQHKGFINVESSMGNGSTFSIYLSPAEEMKEQEKS